MERLHISDTCPQYYCGFLSDTQQQLHINRSNTLLCVHLENNQEHKAYICGLFCGGETCNRKDLRHFEKKVTWQIAATCPRARHLTSSCFTVELLLGAFALSLGNPHCRCVLMCVHEY